MELHFRPKSIFVFDTRLAVFCLVSFAAVIRVVTQRFSPLGEKRCVTTLITAAEETIFCATFIHNATSNCVDFVVKLFDCTWYFLFFTFNITNLACQIDDFLLPCLYKKVDYASFDCCFQHPSSCIRLRSTSFRNPLREDIAGAANLHPDPHGNCGNEPSSRVE